MNEQPATGNIVRLMPARDAESSNTRRGLLEIADMAFEGKIRGVAAVLMMADGTYLSATMGDAAIDRHRAHYAASRLADYLLRPDEYE